MFYKKVFLKFLQNSQENSCAGVYFSCNFNKKEALVQTVCCELSEIGLTSKYKKHMFANVSKESVYMACVYVSQTCCSRKKAYLV